MRVLITGASGFIGSALLKSLRREGHDAIALVRNTAAQPTPSAAAVRLLDLGLLKDLPSIYRLHEHRQKLIELEGMGELSVDKLLAGIEASKSPPLELPA